MGAISVPGNPPITVAVRQSARARRLSLRVSRLDGRVTLTLPRGLARRQAEAFVAEKSGWIRSQVASRPETVDIAEGALLPVGGHMLTVCAASGGRSARIEGDAILVPAGRPPGPLLRAFLKERAREVISPVAHHTAAALGRTVARIDLRDTRSRWGSCSSAGRLMFSWRLAMVPEQVARYVAVHEAAHLVEMNHSAAFWALVEGVCPDWRRHRGWLRDHGTGLHAYRFDPAVPQ